MKIEAEDLESDGYRLIDTMKHDKLMAFVSPYLGKSNRATWSFAIAFFILLSAIMIFAAKMMVSTHSGICILYLIGGGAAAYGLIRVHEYIHAIAYKINGAKKVSYDVNLKKFIFLTVADRFVASRREFVFVAMASFVFLSLGLGAAFFLAEEPWCLFVLGMMLVHTVFCTGDFGLVSYFLDHKGVRMVTYDSRESRETYFYRAPETAC